jgi:hypothetical protein
VTGTTITDRRYRINRQPAERGSGAVFVWARELASDRRAA